MQAIHIPVFDIPAQIQQVFNDGAVFKMARLSKFRSLKAQMEAAVNWL